MIDLKKSWRVFAIRQLFFVLLFVSLLLAACQPAPVAAPTASPTPQPTAEPTPISYGAPSWFEDAVVYEIYVRSFYDADGDGIGDLRGVEAKLDYLQDLGVDVLWLMPIYPSPSVHGYDLTDFFDVNPEYGTLDDLRSLVSAAHEHGLRLILDFVPSHLSDANPLFLEAYNHAGAANEDWFAFTNDRNTQYASFAENRDMPRFNHYNPEVVNYLTDAALFWLQQGVDGFRVDNVTFPPTEFFISLRQSVKAQYPDALLLGEAWVTDPRSLSIYYQDQFDALFDFPLYNLVEALPNGPGDGILNGKSSTSLISALFEEEAERYPSGGLSLRFFSNHDTDRIASETRDDIARQKLAASLLGALPGPLMLYYGEEIGMPGRKGISPYYDSYRRAPFDWYAAEAGEGQATWFMQPDDWNVPGDGISFEEEDTDPASLLNYYRLVFDLNASTPALQSQMIEFPNASWSGQGGLAFVRGEGELLALFNFNEEALTLDLDSFPLAGGELQDLLTGDSYAGAEAGAAWSITLPGKSSLWLVASPR